MAHNFDIDGDGTVDYRELVEAPSMHGESNHRTATWMVSAPSTSVHNFRAKRAAPAPQSQNKPRWDTQPQPYREPRGWAILASGEPADPGPMMSTSTAAFKYVTHGSESKEVKVPHRNISNIPIAAWAGKEEPKAEVFVSSAQRSYRDPRKYQGAMIRKPYPNAQFHKNGTFELPGHPVYNAKVHQDHYETTCQREYTTISHRAFQERVECERNFSQVPFDHDSETTHPKAPPKDPYKSESNRSYTWWHDFYKEHVKDLQPVQDGLPGGTGTRYDPNATREREGHPVYSTRISKGHFNTTSGRAHSAPRRRSKPRVPHGPDLAASKVPLGGGWINREQGYAVPVA